MTRKFLDLAHDAAMAATNLSTDARHLVHVLARVSNGHTGVGTMGQASIAAKMGCSERHVRKLMAELEDAPLTSVRLRRRPRFREFGRGRTSDEWKLILPDRFDCLDEQPEQLAAESDGLIGTTRATNRKNTHDQPEHRSGDPLRDLRSDPQTAAAAAPSGQRYPHPTRGNPGQHKITCPVELALTPEQTKGFDVAGVPDWAQAKLLAAFVLRATGDPDDKRTLAAWRKSAAMAIQGNWNNPDKRPRRDAEDTAAEAKRAREAMEARRERERREQTELARKQLTESRGGSEIVDLGALVAGIG